VQYLTRLLRRPLAGRLGVWSLGAITMLLAAAGLVLAS